MSRAISLIYLFAVFLTFSANAGAFDTLNVPATYEASKEQFFSDIESLKAKWPEFKQGAHALSIDPSLTIDYAWLKASNPKNLIIISTGVHGIEGYIGSLMLHIFLNEYASSINTEDTSILLIHAINPWGMKNRRRYNEHNVDLNRNFILDENFDPAANPDYDLMDPWINPKSTLTGIFKAKAEFWQGLLQGLGELGVDGLRQGMLTGQYRRGNGVQFGGFETQESAGLVRSLFEEALQGYEHILHLDMHSGYGPRYQMSIVNASLEETAASEFMKMFKYPLVVATGSSFYSISGDISEYFYQLKNEKFPEKKFYSAAFEFGTYGDSLLAQIRSMQTLSLENRMFHYGATTEAARAAVRRDYEELFAPSDILWWVKAVKDGRQAFDGILNYYGVLLNP